MIIKTLFEQPQNLKTELLVLGIFEKEKTTEIEELDKLLSRQISELMKNKEFNCEFKELQLITTLGKIKPKKILLVGLGKKKEYTLEKLRRVAALTAKYVRSINIKDFSSNLHSVNIKNTSTFDKAQILTEGTILGLYKFDKYKTIEKNKIKKINSLTILKTNKESLKDVQKGIDFGKLLADEQNYVRDLVNGPASEVTPSYLAAEARRIAKQKNIKVKIYGKNEVKNKFKALYAVSKGSSEEPRMIVLDYNSQKKKKIVFVGKGITFDSGGLDIKPTRWMNYMKSDMAGAAVLISLFNILPKLKPNYRIIGVIPTCENMLGSAAMKPGDIIKTYDKKTIEVINTDAEGRLILSDALALAETFKPNIMIDIATLTGVAIAVLGYYGAPIVGTNEKLINKLIKAGEATYERLWKLPFWAEYKELVKSDIADVRNESKGEGFEAGVITATAFLETFVKSPWVHIDIGGASWIPRTEHYMVEGSTGFGLRLFVEFLKNYK